MLRSIFITCLLASLIGPGAAWSDDAEADALARQIHEAVRQLHELRQQRAAARQGRGDELERLQRQVERLRVEKQTLSATVDERRAEADRLERAAAERAAQRREAEAALGAAVSAAREAAGRFAERANRGTPTQQRRAAAVGDIVRKLNAEEPGERARGVELWHDFVNESLRLHRAIELENRLVGVTDSAAKYAYVLRLGTVGEIYRSEDGIHHGLARRAAEADWLRVESDERAERIDDAIAIVRRKAQVRLTPVPLRLTERDAAEGGRR